MWITISKGEGEGRAIASGNFSDDTMKAIVEDIQERINDGSDCPVTTELARKLFLPMGLMEEPEWIVRISALISALTYEDAHSKVEDELPSGWNIDNVEQY
jgi:hypothetical protein